VLSGGGLGNIDTKIAIILWQDTHVLDRSAANHLAAAAKASLSSGKFAAKNEAQIIGRGKTRGILLGSSARYNRRAKF
jgi:hypothetical protein